ncbi:MAG: hypothetical protein LBN97_07475 [Oscillospiraceae bacterium]|nr:hypothetical protein [Oscillospiraceae bacterium]
MGRLLPLVKTVVLPSFSIMIAPEGYLRGSVPLLTDLAIYFSALITTNTTMRTTATSPATLFALTLSKSTVTLTSVPQIWRRLT